MTKYRAKPVDTPDGRFHSQGEYRRWCELVLLQKGGVISGLRRQVKIPLSARRGGQIGNYVADFQYHDGNLLVTEDFKGFLTPLARWKLHHFEVEYGTKVRITTAARRRAA